MLTTDLTDETGSATLSVDYSGTFDGRQIDEVLFIAETLDDIPNRGSVLRYHDGFSSAVDIGFHARNFAALIYQGGSQRDDVTGTANNDTLYGAGGDDLLTGGGGDQDVISGCDGSDIVVLETGVGNDSVFGGTGNDQLLQVGLNDTVFGGAGWDMVRVDFSLAANGLSISLAELKSGGNLTGVEFIETFMTDHDDTLSFTLNEMVGRDGAEGNFVGNYDGGDGLDTLILDFSAETRFAAYISPSGVLTAEDTAHPDFADDAAGKANLKGWELLDVTGTDFNDEIHGGQFHDVLHGGNGNDTIMAEGNNGVADVAYGGSGNDWLTLGNSFIVQLYGPEVAGGQLFGGNGIDRLVGINGADELQGGQGNDALSGGFGDDSLFGGKGADRLDDNAGRDWMVGGQGNDDLSGGAGTDTLFGGAGDDRLSGGDSADRLSGGEGNDLLTGEGSADRLEGGAGRDTLSGGYSDDTLTGGDGADVFLFEGSSGTGSDVITDYAAGEVLHFGGLVTAADVVLTDQGDDLLVTWQNPNLTWKGGSVLVIGMAGQDIAMTFGDEPLLNWSI